MWTIVLRAAALLGIGAAVGSSVSNTPVIQTVPRPVYQEASSSISPSVWAGFFRCRLTVLERSDPTPQSNENIETIIKKRDVAETRNLMNKSYVKTTNGPNWR